jgi:hypothetical protein
MSLNNAPPPKRTTLEDWYKGIFEEGTDGEVSLKDLDDM